MGTHVAVLHDTLTDSTRVLFWGGSGRPNIAGWSFIPSDSASFPADTDQASTKAHLLSVPNPHRAPERPADIFCSGHAMLPDGSLLVVGGEYFGDMGTPWAFKFNPSGPDSFPWDNSIATMAQDRWYPTATEVASGKILATTGGSHQHMMVFGGLNASGTVQGTPYPFAVSGVSFWDNNSLGQYSQSPPSAREGQAADFDAYWNRVTFFGGDEHVANGRVNEVWGLPASPDDTTYEWRQSTPAGPDGPPVGRTRATMVFVHKTGVPDTAYVFGGLDNNGNALGDLWKGWRPAASDTDSTLFWHWVQLGSTGGPGPRYGHAAVVDDVDGLGSHFAMLIYGGKTDGSSWADNSVWALTHLCEGDPKLTWVQFTPSGTGPGPCQGHA
ncbi:MAG TPA: kelch repeat-containing protein, partial [Candidatus Eisenbacteria bacterium]|nr:kelch repeat-containing protein [Candidatus Eisenbacteria bacterium]